MNGRVSRPSRQRVGPSPPRGRDRPPGGAKVLRAGDHARFDVARRERTGLPEIVLAEGKSNRDLERLIRGLDELPETILISRLTETQRGLIHTLRAEGLALRELPGSGLAILHPGVGERPLRGTTAALITAGTADARVAAEVEGVLKAWGARIVRADDVGVAGLHRLLRALPALREANPGVYLVCAGREGALAPVVAGLVDRPVLGIPTSQGYGRGGRGEAALLTMLQSCAPLAVVNIDGGVPAAVVAAQILRAGSRRGVPGPGSGRSRRRRTRSA